MDMRNLKRIESAGGAARLLLVVAALAGFFAMHGLAATDSAGAHHLGSVVAQHDAHDAMPAADEHGAIAPVFGTATAQDPAQHDAAMVGCVFTLLALAGAIALRALWLTAAQITSATRSGPMLSHGPARAPPCPVFVSLCVFRL
ncbi:hypothetical protein GCM10009609_74860 [Pseudonocardia aurantiaca]|uniref:Uncharacterized protein n=1 Tax=Pseudonocardia aurantiaca TaxID=75290 RepID=A0ABW4FHH3_9PSEU